MVSDQETRYSNFKVNVFLHLVIENICRKILKENIPEDELENICREEERS